MNAGDWFLPMEPIPGGMSLPDAPIMAGAVTIMSGSIEDDEAGTHYPVLVFRFGRPDGAGFLPPICLVLDDDHMGHLPDLVRDGVRMAREHATQQNGST